MGPNTAAAATAAGAVGYVLYSGAAGGGAKAKAASPAATPAFEPEPFDPELAAKNAAEAQAWIAAWKQRTGGFKAKKRFFGLF